MERAGARELLPALPDRGPDAPVQRALCARLRRRHAGDRPRVVPEGAENFAFLGQFAETGRDTIFTTEYSVRTGMEAVYELLDVGRGVPETWGSTYDVRDLLEASARMRDGKKVEIPGPAALRSYLRDRLEHGEIGQLLEEHGLI
nr:oleate hydratase [Brachybacterium kimchii]